MPALRPNELARGDELISPNGKKWVVETIQYDAEHTVTVRSETGRARTMYLREFAHWRKAEPLRLTSRTFYAPSGQGSTIVVTGTDDTFVAREFAKTELRILYTEMGKLPIIVLREDAVIFAPTEEDAHAALTAPATTDGDDW